MLRLETLAREIVQGWGTPGNNARALAMEELLKEMGTNRVDFEKEIEEARLQTNDDLEIDDEPLLSVADDGVWVSAWIWVGA